MQIFLNPGIASFPRLIPDAALLQHFKVGDIFCEVQAADHEYLFFLLLSGKLIFNAEYLHNL